MKSKQVLVLGTAARGGIRSVIDAYETEGFYSSEHARFVATHIEGSLLKRLLIALRAYSLVAYLLMRGKVDVLHVHMSMRGSFWRKSLFVFMGRLTGVPRIIHLHGSEFAVFYNRSGWWTRRIIRSVFDQSNAVVVLSNFWGVFLSALTIAPVTVVGNFVPDRFESIPVHRDPNAILFLGQFGQRKGIYDLIRAFAKVREQVSNAILYCCGNGEVDEVRRLVVELGLQDAVKVPGWVSGEGKMLLLRECSVFVLPSYNEGLPMAILEAMSFSMAIVSTRVGGIPELVDDSNGALLEPGDQEALSSALVKVLKANRTGEIGAESRRRYIKSYSPQTGMSQMRDVYRSLGVEP